MRFHHFLLCLVLATVLSVVSATTEAPIAVTPTMAPETISMVKPTVAPMVEKETLNEAMIMNMPPRVQEKSPELTTAAPMPAPTPTPAPTQAPMMSTTPAPMHSPTPAPPMETMEISTDLNPLKVMGFIAENGNVYEMEGRAGVGMIESRQAAADEEEMQINVCNFGNVVIYSQMPCEEVANIKISELEELPVQANEKEPIKTTEQETDKNTNIKKKNKKRRLQPQQQVQHWNNNFNDYYFDDDYFDNDYFDVVDDDDDDDDSYNFTPQVQFVNRKQAQSNKRPLANRPLKNNKQQNNKQKQQLTQQQKQRNQQQLRQQKLRLQAQQQEFNNQNRRKNVGQNPTRNQNRQFQKNCQSARWRMTARCNGGVRHENSN